MLVVGMVDGLDIVMDEQKVVLMVVLMAAKRADVMVGLMAVSLAARLVAKVLMPPT